MVELMETWIFITELKKFALKVTTVPNTETFRKE
jgi:hypothetical protein